jgi:hypothetical protein
MKQPHYLSVQLTNTTTSFETMLDISLEHMILKLRGLHLQAEANLTERACQHKYYHKHISRLNRLQRTQPGTHENRVKAFKLQKK